MEAKKVEDNNNNNTKKNNSNNNKNNNNSYVPSMKTVGGAGWGREWVSESVMGEQSRRRRKLHWKKLQWKSGQSFVVLVLPVSVCTIRLMQLTLAWCLLTTSRLRGSEFSIVAMYQALITFSFFLCRCGLGPTRPSLACGGLRVVLLRFSGRNGGVDFLFHFAPKRGDQLVDAARREELVVVSGGRIPCCTVAVTCGIRNWRRDGAIGPANILNKYICHTYIVDHQCNIFNYTLQ